MLFRKKVACQTELETVSELLCVEESKSDDNELFKEKVTVMLSK